MCHDDWSELPGDGPQPVRDPADLHPLDRLIQRELVMRILQRLTPQERAIAHLRLQGLSDAEIGQQLGLKRISITQRMARAQQRTIDQLPSAAYLLEGRKHQTSRRQPAGPRQQHSLCAWPHDTPSPTDTNARPNRDDT